MSRAVLIQHSDRSAVAAAVARHGWQVQSSQPVEVRYLRLEDHPELLQHDGREMVRRGERAVWRADVPQSFLPVRFAAAEAMGFKGRCVVTDPDVFPVGPVDELFAIELDRPIRARFVDGVPNSSVMLLDCAELTGWRLDVLMREVFDERLDYQDLLNIRFEPTERIGALDARWNSFDELVRDTRLLHLSGPRTQPWKTGLLWDEATMNNSSARGGGFVGDLYLEHPDPWQARRFFRLLGDAINAGAVTRELVLEHQERGWIRPDVWVQIERSREPVWKDLQRSLHVMARALRGLTRVRSGRNP